MALRQSCLEDAGRLYEQALPIYRQIGDRLGEANCLFSIGALARQANNREAMSQAFQQAAPIYSAIGLQDRARRAREAATAAAP